jgi:hypothetical protein
MRWLAGKLLMQLCGLVRSPVRASRCTAAEVRGAMVALACRGFNRPSPLQCPMASLPLFCCQQLISGVDWCHSMAKRKGIPGAGRPPSGLRGESIYKAYPTVTIRVPPEMRNDMTLMVKTLNRPLWRILVEAYKAYLGDSPALDREKQLDVKYARKLAAAKAKLKGGAQ